MPQLISVLSQLRELKLDDSEVIAAILSAENAGFTQMGKRTYKVRTNDRVIAEVKFNSNHRLSSVTIQSNVWRQLKQKISEDAVVVQPRIARTILFTYRRPKGFARIPGWLQLRPVACDLKDITGLGMLNTNFVAGIPYPFPFVIEVFFRSSNLVFLEAHRRIRAVQEAIWLLSAFLDVAVFSLSIPYSWIFLDGCYQVARCGMSDGLETSSDVEFSNVDELLALAPMPAEQYFGELGVTSREFRVPDLGNLYARYKALSRDNQLRFLRSCASLAAACNPTVESSQKVVSLVSAIEPLLDPTEKCTECRQQRGITKQFRSFLDRYVQPNPAVQALYEGVYHARSRLVHGGWNFDVDEPILGIRPQAHDVPLAAWDATKRGIMKWLLAQ
jgi:hypothetical protein